MGDEDRKAVLVRMPPEEAKALKIMAAEEGEAMGDFVVAAVRARMERVKAARERRERRPKREGSHEA